MEVEMEKHKIECVDLMKCGEITTEMAVGKKKFYLNCSFCDYTFLQLGDFIQHICESHMYQFTNPELEYEDDYSLESHEDTNEADAHTPTKVSDEDSEDNKSEVHDFEKVDIELDGSQMEDSVEFNDLNSMEEYVSEADDNINEKDTEKNNIDGDDEDSLDIAAYRQKLGLNKLFKKNMILAIFKAYEKRRALWDNPTHIRDNRKREYEIKTIAEEVGIPNEWESIRKMIGRFSSRLRTELLRKNIYLSKGKVYTPAWYNDLNSFLKPKQQSAQCKSEIKTATRHTTPTTENVTMSESLLNDAQSILLAEIYRKYSCLWDETDITYRFSNRRREALKAVHEKFNNKSGLSLTEYGIGCEIKRLRKLCSHEKRQTILCKQQNKNHRPSCSFYEHISYLEVDVNPFECSVCEKLITGVSQYKIHLASHDGSLPFKCIVCGNGFKLVENLAVHLRRHAQDYIYKCEVCNKTCATTTEIKTHMRSHTGERPYVCDVCGISFRTSSKISVHMRKHENRPTHICEICTKAFFTKTLYTEHMNVHQNVRDQICNICNKGFISTKRLRQHIQIHAEVKKYACKICDKRFAQNAGLSGHMKSHNTKQVAASSKDVKDVI